MRPILAAVVLAALGCAGCGDGEAETCIPDLAAACEPLYEPTFDEVHARTLGETCALSGCHDAETAESGLDLSTADAAYSSLLDGGFVIPGDAACSTLMLRLEGYQLDVMPPGSKLPDAERCAVQQWIDGGAER